MKLLLAAALLIFPVLSHSAGISGAGVTTASVAAAVNGQAISPSSISATGSISVATTTIPAILFQVQGTTTIFIISNSTTGPAIEIISSPIPTVMNHRRSMGSLSAPTAVINNTTLGIYAWSGNNGTSTSTFSAMIQAVSSGVFTGQNLATHIDSYTTPINTTSRIQRMRISDSGNVGIGTLSNPVITTLEVNGNAQFGSGVTKSTISTTGALTIASGAALTLSGAAGNIVSASSVTASGFFGASAAMTGTVSAGGGGNTIYYCSGSTAGTFDGNLARGNSNAAACAGGTWVATSYRTD